MVNVISAMLIFDARNFLPEEKLVPGFYLQ